METYLFYALALILVTFSILTVTARNPVRSAVYLVSALLAVAGFFFLMEAEFVGAVQVLVYIGSVGILMLFAIMLTTKVIGDPNRPVRSRGWVWGGLAVLALLAGVLLPLIARTGGQSTAPLSQFNPSVKQLGLVLMDPYFASLGVIALLLTAGLIGAVVAATGASEAVEAEAVSAKSPRYPTT